MFTKSFASRAFHFGIKVNPCAHSDQGCRLLGLGKIFSTEISVEGGLQQGVYLILHIEHVDLGPFECRLLPANDMKSSEWF
jgi:hypothetical protein